MNYSLYDVIGNIGVVFIIIAYFLLQANKINSSSIKYCMLNIMGASLVIISLIKNFNMSAFVIEVFWVAISLIGIVKYYKGKNNYPKIVIRDISIRK